MTCTEPAGCNTHTQEYVVPFESLYTKQSSRRVKSIKTPAVDAKTNIETIRSHVAKNFTKYFDGLTDNVLIILESLDSNVQSLLDALCVLCYLYPEAVNRVSFTSRIEGIFISNQKAIRDSKLPVYAASLQLRDVSTSELCLGWLLATLVVVVDSISPANRFGVKFTKIDLLINECAEISPRIGIVLQLARDITTGNKFNGAGYNIPVKCKMIKILENGNLDVATVIDTLKL